MSSRIGMHFAIGLWFGSISSSLLVFGGILFYAWHAELEQNFLFNLPNLIGKRVLSVFFIQY